MSKYKKERERKRTKGKKKGKEETWPKQCNN